MPKIVHFCEFLKISSLRSNSVTRQVTLNRTKIGGKCQNQKFKCDILGNFQTIFLSAFGAKFRSIFKIILTSKDFWPSIYWEKTHSFSCQIRFGLEIVLPPNCLPIIGNNPGNCTAFPVIFKVIYQNWEFKIIFLQCAKNHHHLLKKEDESSKIGRWLFFCIDIQSVALHRRSCTQEIFTPPILKWFLGCSKEARFAKMTY